jgi:hypothetical protein
MTGKDARKRLHWLNASNNYIHPYQTKATNKKSSINAKT